MTSAGDIIDLRVNDTLWILDPIAREVRGRYPVIEHDELVSVGYIALRKASENFDATLGVAFSSYGWTRVLGAMLDVVRKHIGVSSRTHQAGLQAIALLEDTGNVMRDDEKQHRVTASDYMAAAAAAMCANILSSHTTRQISGEIAEQLDQTRSVQALHAAFEVITPEQARLLQLHYMQSTTLRSIAEQLSISYRTAKRRHNEALGALASAIGRIRARQ